VYYYEDARFPHHLTGLTDENDNRFATWAYDAAGRAVLSEHAGGAERVTFTYHPDGSTTATDASGHTRTYAFDTLHGVRKLTSLDGGPCRNCGTQARDITYDVNGFVASRNRFQRPDHPLQPRCAGTRGVPYRSGRGPGRTDGRPPGTRACGCRCQSPSAARRPLYIYDAAGRLLVHTETDPATSATRATTRTYNDLGLLESVDGPRTDVSDITRFAYNGRGDLLSVTDALGHLTEIIAHDAHGRLLAIRYPNSTVTALAYDARGRLISRNGDGHATAFDYDGAGNLLRTTLPNGVFLRYTYDAAHRPIALEDNLGNRIDYTLDALGNRIREDVKDPGGILRRTQSRVYNEINRLVQTIGGENQTTLYAYDANGNVVSFTDPNGNATTQAFDALNRRIETRDALNGVTAFTRRSRSLPWARRRRSGDTPGTDRVG
jgi:YD repeat-containing protein